MSDLPRPIYKQAETKSCFHWIRDKGYKRKAQNMIPSLIEKYEYLERYLPTTLDHDISLCDYLDEWLKSKCISIRTSTYESYSYRVNSMKKYFKKGKSKTGRRYS